MMNQSSRHCLNKLLLLSVVALLPGCNNPFAMKKETSGCVSCDQHGPVVEEEEVVIAGMSPELLKEPVVTFGGQTAATGKDYEKNIQLIMEAQPALKDMLPYIPEENQNEMYAQILDAMALEKTMLRWVQESGIDQTPEYRKNAARVHEAVDRDLALRAFENELAKEITVTDDEIKKYYEEKKDKEPAFQRPPFLVTPSGVKAKGIEAANEKEAQELAEKVKQSSIDQVAKDAKKKVTDYGLVNSQSTIDTQVKDKILGSKTFPSTDVVKGADGKYRVVAITSKQEAQHADVGQVKDAVKQIITGKKFNELHAKKMEDLKKKYKVEVNKEYLNKRKQALQPLAPAEPAEQPVEKPAPAPVAPKPAKGPQQAA